MSETARQPKLIWKTPLRDLLRGRITGRLDWEGRLKRAELPDTARELILRVVKRTRLWRLEKAAVAEELIAHFADALDAGRPIDSVVERFGDENAAVKLIRRAKKRNRPLVWHALRFATYGVWALLLSYSVVFANFYLRQPVVSVDYLAQINADALALPPEKRAWPMLERAMVNLGLLPLYPLNDDATEQQRKLAKLLESNPGDPAWPELMRYLDAHDAELVQLRAAFHMQKLGFVFGPGGTQSDPVLGLSNRPASEADRFLVRTLLPELDCRRYAASVVGADARLARQRGDAERFVRDLEAITAFAQQPDSPFPVNQLANIGIFTLAVDEMDAMLRDSPSLLNGDQLLALTHQIARYGGDTAGSLFSLESDRMTFHDLIQRCYSDDGHGNGELTFAGSKLLQTVAFASSEVEGLAVATTGVTTLLGSRRDVLAEYDRLLDIEERALDRPLRESAKDFTDVTNRVREIRGSRVLTLKYLPIACRFQNAWQCAANAERAFGRRDGVCTGAALELFRRRNGRYPERLDELVPTSLPAVPTDRISGDPVRYRLIDGKPVVYSVGCDRIDDGGRVMMQNGDLIEALAAEWDKAAARKIRGDWILFGMPQELTP